MTEKAEPTGEQGEIVAYKDNIGTLTSVPRSNPKLLRCDPEDYDVDTQRPLPPPSLLPCYFTEPQIKTAAQRYKAMAELLAEGLKYFSEAK